MPNEVSVQLNEASVNYIQEVAEILDVGDGQNASASDVVNYAIGSMIALEKVLSRSINMDDPAEFIKGVADGSIIIVKR